ncbi:MAG TPA: hypothetical protein VMB02_09405 [Candidatus Aquilonibacter sp.]|nr:hypothetical protein [Candidatus Aquilonibacter sp.]
MALAGTIASAQTAAPEVPSPDDLYCSGTVTTESVPHDAVIITGEESNFRITFDEGDNVYINRGASEGVKEGDVFSVVRKAEDPFGIDWTRWQSTILRKMGTVWADEGRVRVTRVFGNSSVARVEHSCDILQRGDILLPFMERPAPPLKSEATFDKFAPANGKPLAMIIIGKNFQAAVGREDVVYVNLGSGQGVKVGDYFRIFRYTGTQHETVFQDPRYAFDQEDQLAVPFFPIYGFGAAPKKYDWSNTPREDVGEGVVLRTGPNASTVLITFSLREIYPGDYVELE